MTSFQSAAETENSKIAKKYINDIFSKYRWIEETRIAEY